MSLTKLASSFPVQVYNTAGFKNKKTALYNIKKQEFQRVLLDLSPEFEALLAKVATALSKVIITNPAIVDEPPKTVKKVRDEEAQEPHDDGDEDMEEEEDDEEGFDEATTQEMLRHLTQMKPAKDTKRVVVKAPKKV